MGRQHSGGSDPQGEREIYLPHPGWECRRLFEALGHGVEITTGLNTVQCTSLARHETLRVNMRPGSRDPDPMPRHTPHHLPLIRHHFEALGTLREI